jgi:hypothetical protein
MILVREVMYCKPGKVRALAEKFKTMAVLMEKMGQGKMRVMTDLSAERYWMLVAEFETNDLASFEKMMSEQPSDPELMKQMEQVMTGYHDLVESGKREIFKIEN